jgi:hypothetical protein
MRSAGNFNPEWGYLAPAPSFMRTARMVVVATAVGATAGAGVVLSLVDHPPVENTRPLVAARAIVVTAVQAATPPTVPLASASASSGVNAVRTPQHASVAAVPTPSPVQPSTAAAVSSSPQDPQASAPDSQSVGATSAPTVPQSSPSVTASTEVPAAGEAAPADVPNDIAVAPEPTPPKKSGHRSSYAYEKPKPFPIETVLRRLFTAHSGTSYYPTR